MNGLKMVRLFNGGTQKGFAELLGVTIPTYRKWEADISEMPVKHVITICEKYGVEPSDLMTKQKSLKEVL